MCYIKNNKCKTLSLWSETKIRKVSHKEAIYGQTRQILSKTRTEGGRRVRFLIAVTLFYIKKNKYKLCGAKTKYAKFHTKKPFIDKLVKYSRKLKQSVEGDFGF